MPEYGVCGIRRMRTRTRAYLVHTNCEGLSGVARTYDLPRHYGMYIHCNSMQSRMAMGVWGRAPEFLGEFRSCHFSDIRFFFDYIPTLKVSVRTTFYELA